MRTKESHREYMRRWRAGEIAPRRTVTLRKEQIAATTTVNAPLPSPSVDIPMVNVPEYGLTVALVQDVQAKHGVPLDHLGAYGRYIAAHKPDVILCIGDFWDMRSLSRHDAPGSKGRENQRYTLDVAAGREAMEQLLDPIQREAGYNPTKIFLHGNHEDRITRYINENPILEGQISLNDLGLENDYGWQVVPFLQPVVIGGVAFCHYFPTGVMGRPIQTPQQLLRDMGMSCVAGHQQGRQIAWARRADGGERCGLITGSFYQHDEDYMGPLANRHWRGTYFLHEVKDGSFAEMALTVNYLLRKWA